MAWGGDGHQIVAMLAEAQLSPAARKEVNRLLALEPGETLTSISTWADEHRNPATAAWHYVNFPRDNCSYAANRDCPDGKCVVGAIEKQLAVLKTDPDDQRRLTALKYLVHLVGDVHQPLHAGYRDDRGGNSYQLQAFGRGTNLHALWDSGLLKALAQSNEAIVKGLLIKSLPSDQKRFDAVKVAEASCKIVDSPGFYPERLLTDEYVREYTPKLLVQLTLAGARLATVLNATME